MLSSFELREIVERCVGLITSDAEYFKAERQARNKLNRINDAAGREYGQDGYGDRYLIALTTEAIQEARMRDYINKRGRAIMARR